MIFKKIIILVVILLIAAAVIYQMNRSYENKLDKMAMDYSYKYLLDLRDHRISDIKSTRFFESDEDIYKAKIFRTINYAVLPGYLKLNNYSDNEIKKKLKIINIKDRETKLSEIQSLLRIYFSNYFSLEYKADIRNRNFRTVLFENGDRSVVILSYYYKGKMYFLPFNALSEKFIFQEYDADVFEFVYCLGSKYYYLTNKKYPDDIGSYTNIEIMRALAAMKVLYIWIGYTQKSIPKDLNILLLKIL